MKTIVDENMVNDTWSPDYGSRDYARMTVQGDATQGPMVYKKFMGRSVLLVCQEICKAAREYGTDVFFDIVPIDIEGTGIDVQFRTYEGQRGQDLTNAVLFDQKRGNLQDPYLEYDYLHEENYIFVRGQGVNDLRDDEEIYSVERQNTSPWARCEGFADARHCAVFHTVKPMATWRGQGISAHDEGFFLMGSHVNSIPPAFY